MSDHGEYGEHEYEIVTRVRVYADNPEDAYEAGARMMRLRMWSNIQIRLIDEDLEPEP